MADIQSNKDFVAFAESTKADQAGQAGNVAISGRDGIVTQLKEAVAAEAAGTGEFTTKVYALVYNVMKKNEDGTESPTTLSIMASDILFTTEGDFDTNLVTYGITD